MTTLTTMTINQPTPSSVDLRRSSRVPAISPGRFGTRAPSRLAQTQAAR
jgi:hypothetical protein